MRVIIILGIKVINLDIEHRQNPRHKFLAKILIGIQTLKSVTLFDFSVHSNAMFER